MKRRLPPLAELQAFELAAERLSFKEAAGLLHLTPSAISHQIRELETFLGVTLFHRLNRKLALTDAGNQYYAIVKDSLEQLRLGTDLLRGDPLTQRVVVSVAPFVGSELITPRLSEFAHSNPHIDLVILAEQAARDPGRGEINIGLRLGNGRWRGLHAEHLMQIDVIPVCAPRLLNECPPSQLLESGPLLHPALPTDAWARWYQARHQVRSKPLQGSVFDNYLGLITACEKGAGVALGMLPLIEPMLQSKRLVSLDHKPVPTGFGYYLVYPQGHRLSAAEQIAITWLKQVMMGHRASSVLPEDG
ncbi:LysR family glycine cleavage system transcriptional activator [Chitinivorax tropicus]|uniref:LysR family glycine cleavage system transcriptional activator n=1 Tax=Chitinivorax tropicus TaxID=714531 RepID=A0A840MES0_9PROT|nr:LysR substrate-binding domain-containing protein [Chitinivorax tropicus]MBB5017178.1 LysR family glycine cleavage system transcriptional activator [Chitinivorax tropicus]